MNNNYLDEAQYNQRFKADDKVLKEALKQAYEIRKFEIDLYWKRATYFWTFIGAAFVGFAAFFNSSAGDANDRAFVLTLISCIGFVFSVAWYCVNKGSKFWQENWENHVSLLEDEVFGPLYKTLTKRPVSTKFTGKFSDLMTGPEPFSVSKINQLVSTYVVIVWALILYSVTGALSLELPIDFRRAIPIVLAILTSVSFWTLGRSHQGKHELLVMQRSVEIKQP